MSTRTTVVGLAMLALIVGVIFVYSGAYDVAATSEHTRVTQWLFETTMHRSVARRAAGVEVPDLHDDDMRLAGAGDFEAMCAGCHTAPGAEPSPMARGLNPPPSDLSDSAQELTAAELFWVTKNGIRMTGMPAWGPTHQDEDLWGVVAFMQALPDLSGDEYQAMLRAAEGKSHHAASGARGPHGNHAHDERDGDGGEERSAEPAGHGGHDHGGHRH